MRAHKKMCRVLIDATSSTNHFTSAFVSEVELVIKDAWLKTTDLFEHFHDGKARVCWGWIESAAKSLLRANL